ncbi:MAG: hypothetical protein AVDCRST_MAG35-1682 [uncultured Quadrisphaera sp.]|uniref:Integral membrane protein n=1 Tax=uncultured Quadrisphaera sp. TaxID=904978 RepID=A0A6J4PK17_9ACTN|nr:MAG: hypothetical protein AVDCRST_MAG35-1682 [uncultured Quadrisphaera sp.]
MAGARRPALLLVVVAAVALEAVVLLAVAAAYLLALVRLGTVDVLFAGLTVALAVAVAVGLLLCAWGLLRGRRWARAPVITWQLLQSAVVGPALGSGFGAGAAALLVLAALVVVGLLLPPVARATAGTQPPPVS